MGRGTMLEVVVLATGCGQRHPDLTGLRAKRITSHSLRVTFATVMFANGSAWAATNFAISESCRLAKVEPRARLCAVIAHIHAGDRDYAAMTAATYAAKAPPRPDCGAVMASSLDASFPRRLSTPHPHPHRPRAAVVPQAVGHRGEPGRLARRSLAAVGAALPCL